MLCTWRETYSLELLTPDVMVCQPSHFEQNVNRKVQGVPQSQAEGNPWHQEEEKKDTNQPVKYKQTNARKVHRAALSSPSL